MRGIRGAITVERNDKEEIWQAAQELIAELLRTNDIAASDIGAAIFSVTEDLTAAFPTAGARRITGFDLVPLFDARQCAIEDSLPRCIRVLLLVNTERAQTDIHHVYLREAAHLRPDLEG
jgi:chorismate mutase